MRTEEETVDAILSGNEKTVTNEEFALVKKAAAAGDASAQCALGCYWGLD